MATLIDLPLGPVNLPGRCVRCGAATSATFPIAKWKGLDLVLVRFGRRYTFSFPACARCSSSLRIIRIATLVVAVMFALPVILIFAFNFDSIEKAVGFLPVRVMGFFILAGPGLYIRHLLESQLNSLWFGVACKEVDTARQRVVFAIRKAEVARALELQSTRVVR